MIEGGVGTRRKPALQHKRKKKKKQITVQHCITFLNNKSRGVEKPRKHQEPRIKFTEGGKSKLPVPLNYGR